MEPSLRAEIAISSIEDVHIIEGTRIGYLRITEFTQTSPKDFEAALRRLEPDATEGLVIDLRFNPGGLLESARLMCSHFLPKDRLVMSVVGRHENETYESLSVGGYKFPAKVPVVILINGGSASAAETSVNSIPALPARLPSFCALIREGNTFGTLSSVSV